jgi:hypothetical protein
MTLCVRCWRIAPRGAPYCGQCGRSFGGTRCEHGHLMPGRGAVSFCPTCRSHALVPWTPSLDFGWLTRALTWVGALAVLRYGFAHPYSVFAIFEAAVAWLVGQPVLGALSAVLSLALSLKVFVWGLGLVDPEGAKRLDPIGKFLPTLLAAGMRAAVWLAKALWYVVEGRPARGKDQTGGPSGKSHQPVGKQR